MHLGPILPPLELVLPLGRPVSDGVGLPPPFPYLFASRRVIPASEINYPFVCSRCQRLAGVTRGREQGLTNIPLLLPAMPCVPYPPESRIWIKRRHKNIYPVMSLISVTNICPSCQMSLISVTNNFLIYCDHTCEETGRFTQPLTKTYTLYSMYSYIYIIGQDSLSRSFSIRTLSRVPRRMSTCDRAKRQCKRQGSNGKKRMGLRNRIL